MRTDAPRNHDDVQVFDHLYFRMRERYGVDLNWAGYDALQAAAKNAALRLNYVANVPGTELRFFHWDGHAILGFYNVVQGRFTTVLPYGDRRWNLVPPESRPEAYWRERDRQARADKAAAARPSDADRIEALESVLAWVFAHNICAHQDGKGFDADVDDVLRRVLLEE
jgi:hypothetical protein